MEAIVIAEIGIGCEDEVVGRGVEVCCIYRLSRVGDQDMTRAPAMKCQWEEEFSVGNRANSVKTRRDEMQ